MSNQQLASVFSKIIVRFVAPGFHCWPEAQGKRSYLASRHRHLFHVEVSTMVGHDNREVEFHDLLDRAKELFLGQEKGSWSCETMARDLAYRLAKEYGRSVTVAVFEDGEVGAEVTMNG